MLSTLTPETDVQTAERLRSQGWSASRILSGLGHPGYGAAHSRRVLAHMEAYGLTAHEAVYGGTEADRKVFLAKAAAR